MIEILTTTNEEYDKMVKIAEENNIPKHLVSKPKHSVAKVIWSIDDIRGKFPQDTSDEELLEKLLNIEKTLINDMTERGHDTIDCLL